MQAVKQSRKEQHARTRCTRMVADSSWEDLSILFDEVTDILKSDKQKLLVDVSILLEDTIVMHEFC